MTTETLERPAAASTVDLDLDVRIVTAGPPSPSTARRGLRGLAWRKGIAPIG
jgi:hypothetical protein